MRRLESRGKLDRLEAAAAAWDVTELDIELLAFSPFAARVWELRGNLAAYDAWYVAIAELVSADCATLVVRSFIREIEARAGPAGNAR